MAVFILSASLVFYRNEISNRTITEAILVALPLGGQIAVNGFDDLLGLTDCVDDRFGAHSDIAAGEDALAGGTAVLVYFDETAVFRLNAGGGVDNFVFRTLADGDDGAVGRIEARLAVADDVALCVEFILKEHRALRCDFGDT